MEAAQDAPVLGAELELNPAEITQGAEPCGKGRTATVFRGTFRGNEVAIKVLDFEKSRLGRKEQNAFDREVNIMATVDHANVVRMFGVTSVCRPFRMITEFCGGGCLFTLLHNRDDIEIEWPQTMKMCQDVANGMNYLHNHDPQIIHRDLKSLNLLISRPGRIDDFTDATVPLIKVCDFGLSKMKDQATEEWERMTQGAGTCHWMAPEVHRGTSYDEKVDIYSYAMIMFEVICREVPFEDKPPKEAVRLAIEGERPDMEAVPPDCPPELSDIMVACWHDDPRHRPSFGSILAALEAVPLPS
jgi:serine/threonine protein kinase